MHLAKVVIACGLVLAVCAEGLPEGNGCSYVEMYSRCQFPKTMLFAILCLYSSCLQHN